MTDVAQLGLAVDSSQAKGAAVDLDRLSSAANGAEAAERRLATSATATGSAIGQQVPATQRMVQQLESHSKAVGLNNVQILEFTHIAKSMVDQIIAGQSPIRALALEAGRLQTAFTYNSSPAQTFEALGGIFTRLLPIIVPVAAAIGGVTLACSAFVDQVNKGQPKALGFFDVLKGTAVTAWRAFTSEFGKAPAWMTDIWDGLGRAVEDGVNGIIRAFAIMGVEINKTLSTLGYSLKSSIATQVVNPTLDELNGATNWLNSALLGRDLTQAEKDKTNIPHIVVHATPADQSAEARAQAEIDRINGTNYLGQIYKSGLPTGDGKSATGRLSPFDRAKQSGQQDLATLKAQADALGKSGEQAAFLQEQTKLLNEATEKGQKLSPTQIADLNSVAEQYAKQKEQLAELTDLYNTGQSATEDFFSTLKSDLMNGTSLWQSFGDAVGTVLDDIANRALQMAADGIWDSIFGGIKNAAGSGGSGDNILSTVLGWFGHNANGTDNWPGGLSWVGENGPELVNLPTGAQVIPNGPAMQMASGANGEGGFVIHNHIDARGAEIGVEAKIANAVTTTLRNQLPQLIQQHTANPARRGYWRGAPA